MFKQLKVLLVTGLLALGFVPKAEAAYAFITSSANECTSTSGTSRNCAAGASIAQNALIIVCATDFSQNFTTPTDSLSNTYTAFGTSASSGASFSNCWYAVNASAGTPTVTFSSVGSTDSVFMYIAGYTGNKTTSVLVTSNKSSSMASSTTETCNSLTPTNTGQLIFGYIQTASGATSFAPHSSETERFEEATFHQTQIEDKTTPNTSALSVSWTLGSAQTSACVTGIFDLAATTPTFTVSPSYSTQSTTQIRATFTCNGATATARGELLPKGSSTPTAAQVAAGTGAHGTNSVACTGSSQTLDITASDSPAFPAYDPYVILDAGGSNYSTVPSTTSTCVTAPTNFQFINCPAGLTAVNDTGSIPALFNALTYKTIAYNAQTANFHVGDLLRDTTSGAWGFILKDVDGGTTGTLTVDIRSGTFSSTDAISDNEGGAATINGAPAAYTTIDIGDILVLPTTVSPSGASFTPDSSSTTGQMTYTASGRQTALSGSIYDLSASQYMTVGLDLYFNNSAPVCAGTTSNKLTYKTNVAITPLNVATICSDVDVETLSFGITLGTLPTGLSFSKAGVLSGTPTVENESGVTIDFRAYDAATTTDFAERVVYPITSWTLANYVGTQSGVSQTALTTATNGSVPITINLQCQSGIPTGQIINQSPAAGSEVAPGDTVTFTVSGGSTTFGQIIVGPNTTVVIPIVQNTCS